MPANIKLDLAGAARILGIRPEDITLECLVEEDAAARLLGVRPQTLSVWRVTGRYDLPYLKIGRNVRYTVGDLMAWMASRRVTSGAQAGAL